MIFIKKYDIIFIENKKERKKEMIEYCLVRKEELEELLEAQEKLTALESGGVDNWSWYSDSLNDYLKEDWEANKETYMKFFNIAESDEDFKYDFTFETIAEYLVEQYEKKTL